MKKFTFFLAPFFLLFLLNCEKNAEMNKPAEKEVVLNNIQTSSSNQTVSSGKAYLEYEPLEGAAKPLPAENSLDTVLLTEFIDFGCGHCYRFSKILPDVKNKFREKLNVRTYVVSWRGENVAKAFYFANMNEKGEAFKNIMFRLFHDSNVKNINNPDILKTLLNELDLMDGSKDNFEALLNAPDILELYREGEEKIRRYKVSGTPTVLIEESVKASWDKNNLTNMINYLLK